MRYRYLTLLIIAAALAFMVGAFQAATEATHNASGGYIDACGDLPGLVGDDC